MLLLLRPFCENGGWGANGMAYNAQLPALCHEFINNGTQMSQAALDNLNALMTAAGGNVTELANACQNYLQILTRYSLLVYSVGCRYGYLFDNFCRLL